MSDNSPDSLVFCASFSIDLADGYQVHLINHDNEACLTIAEVADLVCEGEDSEPEEFLCEQVNAEGQLIGQSSWPRF